MTLSVHLIDEMSFTKINDIPDEEVLRMVTVLLDNLRAVGQENTSQTTF